MKPVLIPPTAWEANSYLLVSDGQALLFDAGASPDSVAETLERENAVLSAILLTHGHFDHILSVDSLRAEYGVPVLVHADDAPLLPDASRNASSFFFGTGFTRKPADRILSDGEEIPFGTDKITVLHTPGHTPGSVCYRVGELLFSGDTLFASGCGRTDLPGGNAEALDASLVSLSHLPGHLTVYPGHGASALLDEALSNLGF